MISNVHDFLFIILFKKLIFIIYISMACFSSTNKLNFKNLIAVNDSQTIINATNKTYDTLAKLEYNNFFYFHNCLFSNRNSVGCGKMKSSDKIIVCEFNAGLYEKSLKTATKSISVSSYPHVSTVHMFLNYFLNAHTINFNLLENFFSTLLLIHPPKAEMFNYYYSIALDCFICFNGQDVDKRNLFLTVLDSLLLSLQGSDRTHSMPVGSKSENYNISFDMTNHLYDASHTNPHIIKRKEFVYFDNLSKSMKISRSLEVLNLLYQILECEFGFWISTKKPKSYELGEDCRPLISYIFWPGKQNLGLINESVIKLLEVYILGMRPEFLDLGIKSLMSDFISLLVEVIRFSDKGEAVKYPFLGKKLNDFARELSIRLCKDSKLQFSATKDSNHNASCTAIISFKQHWFNLLLRSQLLSLITNYRCPPELAGACDILEHIAYSCFETNAEKNLKRSRSASRVNLETVKELKSYGSVNSKLSGGKTLLHSACEKNNVSKVKALLTFPDLEINEIDDDGWTPLHLAAANGSAECTKELLKKRKRLVADTRAQGPGGQTPLMCAASKGHADICRLLLEHTGSILLEDFNENNQTAAEMACSKKIEKILRPYKENFVKTKLSFKNFKYDESYKQTLIVMCFDLVQQYFLTYGTKEIFSYLRRPKFKSNKTHDAVDIRCDIDYERFEKDIRRNIPKLCKVVSAIKLLPHFEEFSWFESILNFLQN